MKNLKTKIGEMIKMKSYDYLKLYDDENSDDDDD